MAAISNNNIARAIYAASKEKSVADQPLFFKNVVQFLARKKMLSKSHEILERLDKIINDDEGKIIAKISSVEKLNDIMRKEITQSLSRRYGGKIILLEEYLDEGLVGGYKIQVNDEVIDLTIANRMKKLQDHLNKSIK